MARVHGICVEKHSELPKEDKRRKFKGRGVLLGNQVKNQNFEAALFQDLGNSPASFESSRWADMFGCLPGHNVQLADAIQAYIQASLTGVACWVELPDEAWPPWINRKSYRRPVVRLIKALYGHPDAGTMWEKHCDQAVTKLGFVPIGPNWPSMYYYSQLNLLLVVYVDDLKLAGPEVNLAKGWTMLRSLRNIEPETDLGMYLGCTLKKGENRLKDGTRVSTMTYDMESFLEQCVEKYKTIAGKGITLKHVATPSLPDDPKQHPARAPCSKGEKHICPWCSCSFSGRGTESQTESAKGISDTAGPDSEVRGELAPHAASVLMKLLYAARIARFDLLRSINNLARNVTKWSKKDDIRLHHLMCYVNSSKSKKMIGWVGDDLSQLTVDIYADADFAGCEDSLRSTSGAHMVIQGKHTRFPVAGASKRQGCVSHSTPEAEIIAADFALRTMGIPVVDLWRSISGKDPQVIFHDDNQAMIAVIRSGKNPTMRHIERSHGISIVWMHEMFLLSYIILIYEITSKMAADIHTKAFRDPMAWKRACLLINVLEDKDISGAEIWDIMQQTHDVASGQRQKIVQSTGTIPTFQYTTTPVVPPEVYTPGMTGKVGLQEIEGCDPVFIVKLPKQSRLAPANLKLNHYLRSTWFLKHGTWQCVESRQQPHGSQPIKEWVERALFQFHPLSNTVPAPRSDPDGQLILSLLPLLDVNPGQQHIHSLPVRPLKVINALTRIVHGGRGDRYSELSHDFTSSDGSSYKGFRTQYEDGQPSRIALLATNEVPEDYWEHMSKAVRRVHQIARKQLYLPLDLYDCPIEPCYFKDTRTTKMIMMNADGSTTETLFQDSWRCLSDASDLRQEREWTGYTEFQVSRKYNDNSPKEDSTSMFSLAVIPKELKTGKESVDVFEDVQIRNEPSKTGKRLGLELRGGSHRLSSKGIELLLCEEDQSDERIGNIAMSLISADERKPRLVLVCSEEINWFTKLEKAVGQYMTIVTITADDDLLSMYRINKVLTCLRDHNDAMFFAGPCTGGSSWARLNKTRSVETALLIRRRQVMFWKLFDAFAHLMGLRKSRKFRSLMELPRHCDYWKDPRMTRFLENDDHHINDFDGCCYGLREQFSHPPKYIKKPWRIISWGVDFEGSLSKKCDGRHEHAPCAGRETIGTQVYTSNIVSTILKKLNEDIDQESVILNKDESRRSPLRVRTRGTKSKATCAVLHQQTPSSNQSLDPNLCPPRSSTCDFTLQLATNPALLHSFSSGYLCGSWPLISQSFRLFDCLGHMSEMATSDSATMPNMTEPLRRGSGGGENDLFMARTPNASVARASCATINYVYDEGDLRVPMFQKGIEMDISQARIWDQVLGLPIVTTFSFWFMTGPIDGERLSIWLFNLHRYACEDDCKRTLSSYMSRAK